MSEWKDPQKKLPEIGQLVAVMIYHGKNHWPLSAEIYFGEVETLLNEDMEIEYYVINNDYTGQGIQQWYLTPSPNEMVYAWCDSESFNKPFGEKA